MVSLSSVEPLHSSGYFAPTKLTDHEEENISSLVEKVASKGTKTVSLSSRRKSSPRIMYAKAKELDDWKGKTVSQLRALIEKADPAAVEEVKWKKPTNPKGVPVWSHNGIVCTVGTLKNTVRLTFLKGAQLKDPKKLFNASLEGNALRAIDFHEGDVVDEVGVKALVLEAVRLNTSKIREP